jgi:HK97 family phage major capsid protein
MATIQDVIAQMEVSREAAQHKQRRASAEITLIIDTATREGRANLTSEEDERVTELFAQRDLAKADEDGINHKLARAQRVVDEEAQAAQRASSGHTAGALPASTRVTNVPQMQVTEKRTYTKESDPQGTGFLRDLVRGTISQDPAANARLSAHMHEERVERQNYAPMMQRAAGDTNTGNWAGLTVPQYLTDMYAPATAALRPFADICNKHPLPADGMSVNISRVTTPSAVSIQATELTAGGEQSLDDTLLTIPVQTALGDQTISRQAIDRGSGIEDVVMQDLFARYATALDNQLLNQSVTGLSASATSVSYADGTPTAAELYPKILAAASGVEGALLAQGIPSHAVMHSRRWYWLSSQLTATWPLINTMGAAFPFSGGVNDPNADYNSGIRGRLPSGLGVVVDNNITTTAGGGTEDELYVVPSRECHLWEDANAPLFIRAEQTKAAALGVLVVVYGYFAYTFGRYANGMQKVSGTGNVTPAF